MKILIATYSTAFQCIGGGEIQLLNTVKELRQLGLQVDLFNPLETKIVDYDIVHYFSVQQGSQVFCKYVKEQNIPLVLSPILWMESLEKNDPIGEVNTLLQISDIILPNSFKEKENIQNFYKIPDNKFHIVHNAYSTHIVRDVNVSFKKKYNITKPFFLNVANIEPRKNQKLLIEAIKNFPEYDLVLIGEIRDKKYFQSLNIDNKQVKYIGYLNNNSEYLISAYRECELFILPSKCETPGISAIEAAVNNVKIIVTKVGSTVEYFKDFVSYVEPDSVNDIVNKIKMQLKSEYKPTDYLKKYTWNNTALETIEAYNKVLSNV